MFVTALYKVQVYVILTFCCTGNKAIMKILKKINKKNKTSMVKALQRFTGFFLAQDQCTG
jgi:hypothetical protein